MSLNWIDTQELPFNSLLLLERVQISWFPGWVPKAEMGTALQANPAVAWYLRNKCPEIGAWLDEVEQAASSAANDAQAVYAAEQVVLKAINDLLVYVIDPTIYEAQPFLNWDSNELLSLVDFSGKVVLDIGSGTGRLAFTAAQLAKTVFCVEPVGNLRIFLRDKAQRMGFDNLYAVDGLITAIPFPDDFADVVMGGHVYGDFPEQERAEMERVTRPGGMVILCPGNGDCDDEIHDGLVMQGYQWGSFLEPPERWYRKYWKVVDK
jgi:SAM-dependent methyltransferase